jgi:hypothetical protein
VNRAKGFPVRGTISQKRTGFLMVEKNAFVRKEGVLIPIDNDDVFFTGVLIIDQKLKVTMDFLNAVYLSHVMTALPALLALKDHGRKLPL